jgi:pilus assembly protein CpaF
VLENSLDLNQFGGERRDDDTFARHAGARSGSVLGEPELAALKTRIHQRLLNDHEAAVLSRASRQRLQELADQTVMAVVQAEEIPISTRLRTRIVAELMDEITGYGPIQPFLEDPTITEIMVNGPHQIFIERGGRLYPTDRIFSDNAHVMRVIERIVSPLGRHVDEASPLVDARLPDGSRVNAIIPPLAVAGPTITVRKYSQQVLSSTDLLRLGTMTEEMLVFLKACVEARLNMLISGGTGSGKTTTLNVLSGFIPSDERIITIEDAAELQLQQEHVVCLESRPPNLEGKGEITIRMLVRNALRMRPDRIIVGEVRGGEALDMLQAMNTGHDGSLSTLHSNSPRDSMARLETITLMAGVELPARAIREQIASGIQLLIHQSRMRDGSRRVTHITEVQGVEGDVIMLQDVFRWEHQGVDGDGRVMGGHRATGLRPRCLERLQERGLQLPLNVFMPAERGKQR